MDRRSTIKYLLVTALERFEAHHGALQPHFAYGELDKPQYEIAHVMHINDHLEAFGSA